MTNRVKHLKKDDMVVLWRSDSSKRQTGKVIAVDHANGMVQVDGIGVTKRHVKPNQTNPKGGIEERLRWWPASKFRVCDNSGKALGRTGYKTKDGKKERVFSKKR
jgi:large subunit ribosomal protein L24